MERPYPSTVLLTVVALLLAPLLLARELGGSYEQHVNSPLMLPSDGAVVPRPELDALPGGVSRSGGRVPPAPKPSHGPHPLREPSPSYGLGSSPACVSGRQGLAPPSPERNTPPHYGRPGPGPGAGVLDALRAFRDALVRYAVGA
ncbi:unnamed protein product [Urochloa decumbens]|uniref:Uncharacterized protein n=1 Tax=Urochloa decumbens TaxID=240449 RepID=A0ABC8WFZ3_9POAL